MKAAHCILRAAELSWKCPANAELLQTTNLLQEGFGARLRPQLHRGCAELPPRKQGAKYLQQGRLLLPTKKCSPCALLPLPRPAAAC